MAIRFQKRIKIAPGIRLNIGKRSAGVSLGPKGASISVGQRGTYANVGGMGTGLSVRHRIGSGVNIVTNAIIKFVLFVLVAVSVITSLIGCAGSPMRAYLDKQDEQISVPVCQSNSTGQVDPTDVTASFEERFAAAKFVDSSESTNSNNYYSSSYSSKSCHWVNGYTRRNGTRVSGYTRCR